MHPIELALEPAVETVGKRSQTRSRWVKRETVSAYKLGARICMVDDLDYFIEQQAQERPEQDTKDLAELREQLVAQILALARTFSQKRNQLIACGRVGQARKKWKRVRNTAKDMARRRAPVSGGSRQARYAVG